MGRAVHDVAVHLDITARNKAGTLFGNSVKKLVVIRWESCSDVEDMLDLATQALNEMDNMSADLLVYDLRETPLEDGLKNDLEIRMFCLAESPVRKLGILHDNSLKVGSWSPPGQGEVLDLPTSLELSAVIPQKTPEVLIQESTSFSEIFENFISKEKEEQKARFALSPSEFTATYGGSFFFIPQLSATVVRTSGNSEDLSLGSFLFLAALAMSERVGAECLVVNSTATPPITTLERLAHAYEEVITPLGQSGRFKYVVQVRAGDDLIYGGAPPIAPLVTAFGCEFFDVKSIEDALTLLRVLRGADVDIAPFVEMADY